MHWPRVRVTNESLFSVANNADKTFASRAYPGGLGPTTAPSLAWQFSPLFRETIR